MSVAIAITMTEQSRSVIDKWQQRPRETVDALDRALTEVLFTVEKHIKETKLRGDPVKPRSGALFQDLTNKKTSATSGFVGTTKRTSRYARTILGPGTTTITPKSAKHLWIPIADNLTPSGAAKLTPRDMFDKYDRSRISIFKSKRGNTVAFVRDEASDKGPRVKRGKRKGQLRGQLLFVLKDQVVIQGTDALAQGANEMTDRMANIFARHLSAVGGTG